MERCCNGAGALGGGRAKGGLQYVGEGGRGGCTPKHPVNISPDRKAEEGKTNTDEVEAVKTLPGDDSYRLSFAEKSYFRWCQWPVG